MGGREKLAELNEQRIAQENELAAAKERLAQAGENDAYVYAYADAVNSANMALGELNEAISSTEGSIATSVR